MHQEVAGSEINHRISSCSSTTVHVRHVSLSKLNYIERGSLIALGLRELLSENFLKHVTLVAIEGGRPCMGLETGQQSHVLGTKQHLAMVHNQSARHDPDEQ